MELNIFGVIRISNVIMSMKSYVNHFQKDIIEYAKKKNVGIIHAASNYPNGFAAIVAAKSLRVKSLI
ncbi:MAG: hypothetical protein R3A45_11640 [Bdellovibrionota bacterium]